MQILGIRLQVLELQRDLDKASTIDRDLDPALMIRSRVHDNIGFPYNKEL